MSESPEPTKVVVTEVKGTVTIQQTHKIFKVLMMLGRLCLLGAIVLLFTNADQGAAIAALGIIGLGLYVVGRVGKWWCND